MNLIDKIAACYKENSYKYMYMQVKIFYFVTMNQAFRHSQYKLL